MLCFADVVHTQGPVDGSLYAKIRKKDSTEGIVSSNGLPTTDRSHPPLQQAAAAANRALPLPVANHALPIAEHALSVSSDSGNSSASIKTDRTDDPQTQQCSGAGGAGPSGCVSASQPAAPPSLSPREKRELEQLLSGLQGGHHQLHQQQYARQQCVHQHGRHQCYAAPSGGGGNSAAGGGILHLVPAQVHVSGRGPYMSIYLL